MNSYNKLIHKLELIVDLYLFSSPRRSYGAYTCTEVPVGTTKLILVPIVDLYLFKSPLGVTELILIQGYL